MKLIAQSVILEGITHIEDLPLSDFMNAVETLKDKTVTEKLDGSNLWFGVDDKGFFTSREGKSRKGTRFYKVGDYPMVASYNGFRGAHEALSRHQDTIKRHLHPGDMVEVEVLFGRQPNTVTYGNDEKNFIVILRGVDTDQKKVDALAKALNGKHSKVASSVITSDDGENLKQEDVNQLWEFTQVKPLDTKSVDISAAMVKLSELKKYLKQPNTKVPGKTNQEIAEISLNKVPKEQREAVKAEREVQLATIMKNYKEPIKKILLDTLVRKVKPFLQTKDVQPDEDIGVEGVVASDKKGNMVKIVDKDMFTAINTFNNYVRNNIAGLVRTDDKDAPTEMRGGAFGEAKLRIANLLGMKELAMSSSSRKILTKFKGSTAAETAKNVADSVHLVSFESVRRKTAAILENAVEEIDEILSSFKDNADTYKLKLETGKEIGISPEVMKRTLTAFAETKRDINQIKTAVLKSRDLPEMIMALYGRTIQGLFSGDQEVKESKKFSLLKSVAEDGEGGEPGTTSSGDIAPVEKRLMGGRMITRRARKYVKKKKFAQVKESKSLLKLIEFDMGAPMNQFAKDVDDGVAAKNDVEFKSLRNQMKTSGDQATQQDVVNYLDKAHELNDEVDTVTFGMEMDDGSVVKVYVNATEADAFEAALSELLGEEDDIEEVIDKLANEFDIVDVEWPGGAEQQSGDALVAVDQNNEITGDAETPSGDGEINSEPDADGVEQVSPVINLTPDEEGGEEQPEGGEEGSLMQKVDAQADDAEAEGQPDLSLVGDDGSEEQPPEGGEAPTDGEPPADDASSSDETPPEDGEAPPDAEGGDTGADLGDVEPPADEESEDEQADDDTPPDGEGGGGKKKKPKKKKDDTSSDEAPDLNQTEESASMSFGQRFKEKLLAEKAELKKGKDPEKKKKDEVDPNPEDQHEFPEQLKKLMLEFPSPGSKMMVGLMHTMGAPLEAMIMKKSELKKSVEAAGDQYMKDSQLRMWVKRVISAISEAKSKGTVKEAGLEQELTNQFQKLVLSILAKIGMTEGIEKIGRAQLRNGVRAVANLAQTDNKVRTNLKVLAEMLGVDAVTGDAVAEAKNHLGEPEQTTYAGWKRACKAALAKADSSITAWLEGDEDIAELFIGEKPYKRGKTFSIGQWEGDKGSVYDVKDSVDSLKKVAEEALSEGGLKKNVGPAWWVIDKDGGDAGPFKASQLEKVKKEMEKGDKLVYGILSASTGEIEKMAAPKSVKEASLPMTQTEFETGIEGFVSSVKQLATALGIPEGNINYRPNQVDMAIKRKRTDIKSIAQVQMQIKRLLDLLNK